MAVVRHQKRRGSSLLQLVPYFLLLLTLQQKIYTLSHICTLSTKNGVSSKERPEGPLKVTVDGCRLDAGQYLYQPDATPASGRSPIAPHA